MARYDPLRKLARNEQLREYAKAHPELSMREVGEAFGVTASRAHRIINGNQKDKPKLQRQTNGKS
jgi:plasmid maintenance system antidote protein VapI